MKIIKEFEGAMIGDAEIKGSDVFLTLRDEKKTCADGFYHEYGYHYSFGLMNDSSEPIEAGHSFNCRSKSCVSI